LQYVSNSKQASSSFLSQGVSHDGMYIIQACLW
jgi:hypothetical protein